MNSVVSFLSRSILGLGLLWTSASAFGADSGRIFLQDAWTRQLAHLFGAAPIHDLQGNGSLTLGLSQGGLISCRWPDVSGREQILPLSYFDSFDTQLEAGFPVGGCWWGIVETSGISWIGLPPWEPEAGEKGLFIHPQTGIHARIYSLVKPDRDIAEIGIYLTECPDRPALVWLQQCRPTGKALPSWPAASPSRPQEYGVWLDTEKQRGFFVQPALDSPDAYDHLHRLMTRKAVAAEWESLGEGVWSGGWVHAEDTTLTVVDQEDVSGHCGVLYRGFPYKKEEGYGAAAYIAFAKDAPKTNALLDGISAEEVLPPPAEKLRPSFDPLRWLTIATDKQSDLTVHAPVGTGAIGLAHPSWACFIGWAWGIHGESQRALHQITPFIEAAQGNKEGIVPGFITSSGAAAAPEYTYSPDDAAWILLACAKVLEALPDSERKAGWAASWAKLMPIEERLSRWVDPATGMPRPGFSPDRLCAASSEESLLLTGVMIEVLTDIAERYALPLPENWTTWRGQINALLRFHMVNQSEKGWALSPTLAFIAGESLAPQNTLRQALVTIGEDTLPLEQWPLRIRQEVMAASEKRLPITSSLDAALRYLCAQKPLSAY